MSTLATEPPAGHTILLICFSFEIIASEFDVCGVFYTLLVKTREIRVRFIIGNLDPHWKCFMSDDIHGAYLGFRSMTWSQILNLTTFTELLTNSPVQHLATCVTKRTT